MEMIERYPDKPWYWVGISYNPNLIMEMIERYQDKPGNWGGISYNPNLTMEMIEKYPDNSWRWDRISSNGMNYDARYLAEAKCQLAALRIQLHWMKARYNPAYKMCRYLFFKRMKKTFTENGYDFPVDEDTREDIGDWLALNN
jgi:hypothetical protein